MRSRMAFASMVGGVGAAIGLVAAGVAGCEEGAASSELPQAAAATQNATVTKSLFIIYLGCARTRAPILSNCSHRTARLEKEERCHLAGVEVVITDDDQWPHAVAAGRTPREAFEVVEIRQSR